jgi:hypothetical protein
MLNNLMPALNHGLLYGTILSGLLTVLVLWSMWFNPEMWLHDAPKEVQAKFGPMSANAKRQRSLIAILIYGVIIALPWLALSQLAARGVSLDFWPVFVTLFTTMMFFNLVDLLLIDWFVIEWWRPDFLFNRNPQLAALLPGNDYATHFYGFLKGTAGITLVSLLVAAVVSWAV